MHLLQKDLRRHVTTRDMLQCGHSERPGVANEKRKETTKTYDFDNKFLDKTTKNSTRKAEYNRAYIPAFH